jgi:hypothetical protein
MQPTRDLSKSWIEDENFFKHMCEVGRKYEAIVMQKLIDAGIEDVQLLDDGFRKNVADIKRYTTNSKDLLIKGWPFEVKSRNVYFTDPDDWPANYWPMFLDTVAGFESKKAKPVGYIFISQKTGAMMAASTAKINRQKWDTQRRFDRERKIWDTFYSLNREDVISEDELITKLLAMKTKPE